jgi:hypothetical protein
MPPGRDNGAMADHRLGTYPFGEPLYPIGASGQDAEAHLRLRGGLNSRAIGSDSTPTWWQATPLNGGGSSNRPLKGSRRWQTHRCRPSN